MTYKILKPEITNISNVVWSTLRVRWDFWMAVIVGFIVSAFFAVLGVIIFLSTIDIFNAGVSLGIALLLFVVSILPHYVWARNRIESIFWKQVAEVNGWQYKENSDVSKEPGVMFRQGHSGNISYYIEGVIHGRQFRIFRYTFTVGYGKATTHYSYIVFAFKFNGSFPHIYLNNKHNAYGISTGEKIPLPLEFEKKFSLSAPKKYEIEALQIFTPDVLAKMLDNGFIYDIEFVEQEVLMFVGGAINDFEKLENAFNKALELEDLLDEKLDKFKFNTIGNMPHILK